MGSLEPMKRVAKIIGFIGGVAALIWAMRDRFISVATSREPEPPRFKRPPGPETVATIDGIGPVYEKRLGEAGIDTVESLAEASPDSVAEAAAVSVARARDWIEQARQRP